MVVFLLLLVGSVGVVDGVEPCTEPVVHDEDRRRDHSDDNHDCVRYCRQDNDAIGCSISDTWDMSAVTTIEGLYMDNFLFNLPSRLGGGTCRG